MTGCGSDDKHGGLPDGPLAPPSDGAVDTPADTATDTSDPRNPVTLTVVRNGVPQSGVHTYFLNADSSVVATLDTDASGTVTAVMAAGGSVTALNPFPPIAQAAVPLQDNELRTFLGVKPGDHLVLTHNDKLSVSVEAPVDNGSIEYDLHTTCGGGSLSVGGGAGSGAPGGTVTLVGCGGTADVLVIAKEPDEGPPRTFGALYHPDQAINDLGTVDLSGDGYDQALDIVRFSYTNTPDASLTVSHALVSPHGALTPFVASADAGATSIIEPTALPGITGSIVDLQLDTRGIHHVVDWGAPAATYALDLTGLLLPGFLGEPPAYDVTARRVRWMEEDPNGATPDLTVAQIDVFGVDRTWHWTVAAPYTAGELAFPVLPGDVADWTPVDTDDPQVAEVTSVKLPGGYDAVRAHIHDVHDAIAFGGFTGLTVGAAGRAVAVQFVLPPPIEGQSRRAHAVHRR